jgi:hypothetical protein
MQTSQRPFAPKPVIETIQNTGLRCLKLDKNAVLCADFQLIVITMRNDNVIMHKFYEFYIHHVFCIVCIC